MRLRQSIIVGISLILGMILGFLACRDSSPSSPILSPTTVQEEKNAELDSRLPSQTTRDAAAQTTTRRVGLSSPSPSLAVAAPSQFLPPSISLDAIDFMVLAERCTDKTTSHRYQMMYSRVLHHYRHPGSAITLLEMGLGCNMANCVAGGARLLRTYLPAMRYHVLEYRPQACEARYGTSSVTPQLAKYIQNHLCAGSSDDPDVLRACGTKFGPFEVIIDDASHYQKHVVAAFNYWYLSPFLKAGGVYVVEDLQVAFYEGWEAEERGLPMVTKRIGGKKHQVLKDPLPQTARNLYTGKTFVNIAQSALLCKWAGRMCQWPVSANIAQIVEASEEVIIGHECAALRRRG